MKAEVFVVIDGEWVTNYYCRYSDGTQGGFKLHKQKKPNLYGVGSLVYPNWFDSIDGRMTQHQMLQAVQEWNDAKKQPQRAG